MVSSPYWIPSPFIIQPHCPVSALGTFKPTGECGGGSPFPTDWRYIIEVGGGLGGYFMTLTETPYGILYTGNCSGSEQTILDLETGESTSFASDFARAVVSPDGERVAGIQVDFETYSNRNIFVYDLATGDLEVIDTKGDPNLVVWSYDGTALFYSTRVYSHNLIDGLSEDQLTALDATMLYKMDNIPSYQVTLHRISLDSLQDTLIYQGEHSAISRIFDTPAMVYASVIPNLDMWMSMVIARQVSPTDDWASLATVEVGVLQFEYTSRGFGEAVFLAFHELFTPFVR